MIQRQEYAYRWANVVKKILTLLLVFVTQTVIAHGQTNSVHPAPRSFPPDFLETVIPEISLTNATVERAVAVLSESWSRQTGSTNPPIIVTVAYVHTNDDGTAYEGYPGLRQRITLHAKNIAVADCLHLIAEISGHQLKIKGGFLELEQHDWIEEDWVYASLPVSDRCRKELGLTDDPRAVDLVAKFKSYGIHFEPWMEAECHWFPAISKIRVYNLPAEVDNIEGLFRLWDGGFEIRKKPDEAAKSPTRTEPQP